MLRSIRMWVMFGLLLCLPLAAQANHHHPRNDAAPETISLTLLPPEARNTLSLVKQHGPFPFPRDGVEFSNFEHRLPQQPRGYYHEFTVKTPAAHSRGARRIVCGPLPECYYTGDHYRTFQRIRE